MYVERKRIFFFWFFVLFPLVSKIQNDYKFYLSMRSMCIKGEIYAWEYNSVMNPGNGKGTNEILFSLSTRVLRAKGLLFSC